jgi:hypothetical protein
MINSVEMTQAREMCSRWRNSRIWTPPRVELRDALLRIAPHLAELYEGAVLLLYECPVPGRGRLIAHAVREIGNALPEKITGQSFPKRFDPTNHLDDLVDEWKKSGLSIHGGATVLEEQTAFILDNGYVRLPQKLYARIAKLIERHGQSRTSNRQKAVELFKACDTQNPNQVELLMPVLKKWLDVVQWFVGLAHDRKRLDEEILKEDLPAQFEVFEAALRAMTTDFFGTISEELDEILENANS